MANRDQLSSRERVKLAIQGAEIDRPPVSLWAHFPERDQTADDLAEATLEWQAQFDCDFVKFMPPGDYATIDWGAKSVYEGATGGTRTTTTFPINGIADWRTLESVAPRSGFTQVILDSIQQTRASLSPDVPLLQTIFSPLTIAMKLSNGAAIKHLRAEADQVLPALAVIAETTRAMLVASLESGADGIFFATQCADEELMTEEEYRNQALPDDLKVLEGLPSDRPLIIHLHGSKPMLGLAGQYPHGLVNWHDRFAGPPLPEGHRITGRPVCGGINEKTIATSTPDVVAAEAAGASRSMNGRSLAVTPGCVIPITTPRENVRAAVEAVKSLAIRNLAS